MKDLLERVFDPSNHPWLKASASFFGWALGVFTLSNAVLLVTFLLTTAQLYFVIRDKWYRDPKRTRRREIRRAHRSSWRKQRTGRTPRPSELDSQVEEG